MEFLILSLPLVPSTLLVPPLMREMFSMVSVHVDHQRAQSVRFSLKSISSTAKTTVVWPETASVVLRL